MLAHEVTLLFCAYTHTQWGGKNCVLSYHGQGFHSSLSGCVTTHPVHLPSCQASHRHLVHWKFPSQLLCNVSYRLVLIVLHYPSPPLSYSSLSSGPAEGSCVDFCQQAGYEGLYVCSGDLQIPHPQLHQRPPLAHPVVLRAHRRGVRRPQIDTSHTHPHAHTHTLKRTEDKLSLLSHFLSSSQTV